MKKHEHDHDMIAEDRPSTDPEWEELSIMRRVIGDTRIEFLCADNGNPEDRTDYRYETRRRKPMTLGSTVEWIDPTHHELAVYAIQDANAHMPHGKWLTTDEMMMVASDIYDKAAQFFYERDSQ